MEYRLIEAQELRKWWAGVRPGLELIQRKTPEEWIPEDIYADCFNGRAMLFAILESQSVKGYFVVQPNGIYLHVWAAWSLENKEEIVIQGLEFVKNLARNGGAQFVTFSSHRRGWDKRAAELGFKPRQWICEV